MDIADVVAKDELFKMTAMQRLYFEGRARGLRPTDAARAAGSEAPKDYASLMEKHPRLRLLMQEMNQHLMKKAALSREDVLGGLQDAIHAAETAGEMVAGWREIGKILGVYAPQVVEHHTNPARRDMRAMSDEDLLDLAETENHQLTDDDRVVSIVVQDVEDAKYVDLGPEPSSAQEEITTVGSKESEEVVQEARTTDGNSQG